MLAVGVAASARLRPSSRGYFFDKLTPRIHRTRGASLLAPRETSRRKDNIENIRNSRGRGVYRLTSIFRPPFPAVAEAAASGRSYAAAVGDEFPRLKSSIRKRKPRRRTRGAGVPINIYAES